MNDTIKSVCVYCAGSKKTPQKFIAETEILGEMIAKKGYRLVYGGGGYGLMGAVSNAVLDKDGHVTAFMPEHLRELEAYNKRVEDFNIVQTMHERKTKMVEESDAFIVLPGGVGTLDELVELLSWRKLGIIDNPVVILNMDGYWDKFQVLLEDMMSQNLLPPAFKDNWIMVKTAQEAIKALENATFERFDLKAHLI